MFRLLLVALLSLTVLSGCGPDANQQAANDYVEAMTPLLKRNTTLSKTFLDMAAKIKREELTTAQIAKQFTKRVVPQAEQLQNDVAKVQPRPTSVEEVHLGLVRAWSNRANAYRQMADSWAAGDLASFNGAARDHATVNKAEERYFEAINTLLMQHGLVLQPYP